MTQSPNLQRSAVRALLVSASAVIVIIVFLFALNSIISVRGNAFDFYPNWAGSRAVLSGEVPYSRAVTERIQIGMFGAVGTNQGDEHSFAHPAYSAFVLLPVALLNAPLATAAWMTFQIVAIALSLGLWLHLLRWRPKPLVFSLVLFGCLLAFRHPINVYLLGQFPGSILLGFSLGIWLLLRRQDALAGLALLLCTVPPTVGGTLALALAGSLLLAGRWKTLATLLGALTVLNVLTFGLIGFWIPAWLDMLNQYSHYAHPVWPPAVLGSPLLEAGFVLAVLAAAALALRRFAQHASTDRLLELVLTILAAGLLLLPTTGSYYLVLALPLLLAALARGSLVAISLATATLISPWIFFAWTDGIGTPAELLIIPLLAWISWRLALRFPRCRNRAPGAAQAHTVPAN